MTKPDLAGMPPRRELEPSERVDRDRVDADAAHVTKGDVSAALVDERADALAEPWVVAARDRVAYLSGAGGYLSEEGELQRVTVP